MDTEEVLTRGVAEILPDKAGLTKLMSEKKITLYQGFDPSMPSLHLGNFVGLMKLRQFQKLGHKVIFLIGDFTGMIGDPTDKLATRKQLTREEVTKNAEDWKKQAERILDFEGPNPVQILRNSEWSDKITFKDLIEITSKITYQQLIERDMYQERIKRNEPIYLHELLYPIAQGYDCVAMDVDLEIGGNDQLFNMVVGRILMKAIKGKEKYVLTTKLLVDKDGKKVGKTTGNALFLDSTPENFYGGIMSFPDEVIELGFELLTDVDMKGISEEVKNDPMKAKKRLAFEIVKLLWGEKDAENSQNTFESTFQNKENPESAKEVEIDRETSLSDLISIEVGSKSEAKRLISQKAVDINGKTVEDVNLKIGGGENIKVGKKLFLTIKRK